MRVASVGVISMAIVAGACGGGSVSAARNDLATPAGTTARDARGTEAATTGGSHVREITIPAGATLPIVLDTEIGSDTSHAEEAVAAHLAHAVTVHGETVLPAGSRVGGVVTSAVPSGRVKGRAHVAVRFDSVSPKGEDERYTIHAASIGRTAESTKKKDALEIGAPAAGGALIGAIVGGKKGAAVGGAIGGGAGAGVVLSTRGDEVRMPKGAALTLKLTAPVTVRVR